MADTRCLGCGTVIEGSPCPNCDNGCTARPQPKVDDGLLPWVVGTQHMLRGLVDQLPNMHPSDVEVLAHELISLAERCSEAANYLRSRAGVLRSAKNMGYRKTSRYP